MASGISSCIFCCSGGVLTAAPAGDGDSGATIADRTIDGSIYGPYRVTDKELKIDEAFRRCSAGVLTGVFRR